jgi:uncharacterized membrane protein YphA (DoxX/SURF4 family)
MEFEKRRKIVSFLMRVIVGFVLIYSGYIKIIEPKEQFVSSILSYKIVGEGIASIVADFLPWIELYLGLIFAFGIFINIISFFIFGIFGVFEVILLQAIIRGLEITNCGCFGTSHSNPIGVEFALNLIWIIFSWFSFKYSKDISIDHLVEKKFSK